MQTLLAFCPFPSPLSCLHAPFHPSPPRLFRFSFIQRPTRLSLSFVSSRDAASFRVFPTPLFPLLFSSREFLTRPFRAPLFLSLLNRKWRVVGLFQLSASLSPIFLVGILLINDFRAYSLYLTSSWVKIGIIIIYVETS